MKQVTYKINEIFYSIQGEGHHVGMPAIFIRFSGCNLNCEFCDTDHNDYTNMTADYIINRIKDYPVKTIVLTGGEPYLQLDENLCIALHDAGYNLHVETNGLIYKKLPIDWITVSPKENLEAHYFVDEFDELKVVYTGQNIEDDYRFSPAKHFYLQPCSEKNIPETIAKVKENPKWKLSLQIHKILKIR